MSADDVHGQKKCKYKITHIEVGRELKLDLWLYTLNLVSILARVYV